MRYQIKGTIEYFKINKKFNFSWISQINFKTFELFTEKSWNIHFCMIESLIFALQCYICFVQLGFKFELQHNVWVHAAIFQHLFYASLMKAECLFWK